MDDNGNSSGNSTAAGFVTFPPAIDYIQATITLVIFVISLTVNLLIVYLVVRFKRLRKRAFLLTLQLVAFNLCYTVMVLPVVFVSAVLRRWVLGDVACYILGGIANGFFTTNFLTILILTLDRFFTIFMPFFYDRHGNKIATGMFLLLCLAVVLRFVINASLGCFKFALTHKMCVASGTTEICTVATATFAWVHVFAGVVVPIVLYIIMYMKGRQLNKRLAISEEERNDQSLFKFNKRVFKTFLRLLIVLVGVSLVAITLYIWFIVYSKINLAFYIVQALIGRTLSNGITIANPIIILLNREVREAWKEKHNHSSVSKV